MPYTYLTRASSVLARSGPSYAALLLCVVLTALAPLGSRTVHAAVTRDASLTARDLALQASAFPRGAKLGRGPLTNGAADAVAPWHTRSFASLGRLTGNRQSARWAVGGKTVTMQYMPSLFATPDQALTASADAEASLWELGHPMRLPGLRRPAFLVTERTRRADVVLEVPRGTIAAELSVSYPTALKQQLQKGIARALGHAGAAATTLLGRLVPRDVPLSPPGGIPPIAVAPWGIGPVVKSPSLMVLGGPDTQIGPAALPGLFRSDRPPLASRAQGAVGLAPPGGLSGFVRTGPTGNAGELYDAATLFRDPSSAGASFVALAAASGRVKGLRSANLQSALGGTHRLAAADAAAGWTGLGETLLVVRQDNVILSLAETGGAVGDLASLADALLGSVPSWLHADGTSIVDAAGAPVHLDGLNWYGAEQNDFVVGGLSYRSYEDVLETIKTLGYNSIRLPFSNQLVEQNPVVTSHVNANPELQGLHALDILDRIINYAGALGLSVILDDHRSEAGWSAEASGLWYTPAYGEDAFVRDWQLLAQRYAVSNVVIGADLRNEPHGLATWGTGVPATDWRAAAERAGDAALAQNPHLLIMVEGVQSYGTAPGYWWGGNLMGVASAPVDLRFADGSSARSRLVYSAHDYGGDNCGGGCPWFNATTTYATLSQMWDQYWGYIASDPKAPYAAPVWVGEFGTCNYGKDCVEGDTPGSQGQWFASLVRYLGERHLGWCYWSVNGTQSSADGRVYGSLDWYGLLSMTWLAPVPYLHDALRPIQTDAGTGGVPAP